jgi:glycosyltransferase involved in cell wall biosynthesis
LLYICIPAHNEASTLGVLLWRIRKVFQGYSREYEVVVYDDASTDGTSDILAPYGEVAPLTVIRGETRLGYGKAVELLIREASRRTRYPRRDGMILMQGDFTDQPEGLPELVKRFEGGADIVLATRGVAGEPPAVRRLRQLAPWALRFSVGVDGIADPYASFRLFRISLFRDLIKSIGEKPLLSSDGWSANVELLIKTVQLARRVETVALESRYDLRVRQSRIRPFADAMAIFRFGRTVKGHRITVPAPAARPPRPSPTGRGAQRQQATS